MHTLSKIIIVLSISFVLLLTFLYFFFVYYLLGNTYFDELVLKGMLKLNTNSNFSIGLAAYGICNNSNYLVNTTSIMSNFTIYNISVESTEFNSNYSSLQLNAPIKSSNDVLLLQNALELSNKSFEFVENVLSLQGNVNLSGEGLKYTSISLSNCSGNVTNSSYINPEITYIYSGNIYKVSLPIKGFLGIKLLQNPLRIEFYGRVNNFTLNQTVITNLSTGFIISSPKFYVVGSKLNPLSLGMFYATPEIVFAGSGCGNTAIFHKLNAELSLEYLNNSYLPFSCYYTEGTNIAEKAYGIFPYKCINNSVIFSNTTNISKSFAYINCS
ncbi:MAG: thermopsin family protease [Candidatus Rehaiarchaeum fermentans]|nr:thermopsin [Candidatus Rehaiarchaeum fermentans]